MNKHHEEYQFLELLKKIIDNGSKSDDRTNTGTLKVWGEKMEFSLEDNAIPLMTTRKVNPRLFIEELVWFLSGSTDVKKLQEKNVKIWNGNGSKEECEKFGRSEGDLGPIYGHQWRNFNATLRDEPLKEDYYSHKNLRWINRAYNDDGYDQIKNIVNLIIKNPNSRRILFSGWNPAEADIVNPPPCHTFYQFQVDNGKLNSLVYMRSSDTFLALAGFNIPSLAVLTHVLAHVCGLEAGKLVWFGADTHLYSNHLDQAKIQIQRKPYDFPKIKINDRLKNKQFKGLMDFKIDDIEIINYKYHEKLTGKMAV